MKSFLGNFYRHLAIFFWSHWSNATRNVLLLILMKNGAFTSPRTDVWGAAIDAGPTQPDASSSVWPDIWIKSSPKFPKVAQKIAKQFLYKSSVFRKQLKISPNVWTTFVKEICCQELSKIAQSGHTDASTSSSSERTSEQTGWKVLSN